MGVRCGKFWSDLEKFAKVSESLIKFLYFLKLRSLRDLLECSVGG